MGALLTAKLSTSPQNVMPKHRSVSCQLTAHSIGPAPRRGFRLSYSLKYVQTKISYFRIFFSNYIDCNYKQKVNRSLVVSEIILKSAVQPVVIFSCAVGKKLRKSIHYCRV